MQIKDLSKQVNLPISTIRYYEKLNLIQPKKNGYYKQYTTAIKEQLLSIKKLHTAGFNLSQIQRLFLLNDKDELKIEEILLIEKLLITHINHIENKVKELEASKEALKRMLKKLQMLYEAY